MKPIALIALIATAIASPASHADELTEACEKISNLAKIVMQKRQDGIEMSALMRVASSADDETAKTLMRGIITAAYEQQRYNTESYTTKAVTDFTNDAYLECIKMGDAQ